jgi:hypothetical protein
MNDNTTFAQQMVAAVPVAGHNVKLQTHFKQMAVIKVWEATLCSARKYVESEGFVAGHNLVGVTGADNADALLPKPRLRGAGRGGSSIKEMEDKRESGHRSVRG